MIVTFDALSPLSHGAFDAGNIGNATPFRRYPIVSLPGRPEIPAVSGNSIRAKMRRIVMRDLFVRCGLSRASFGGREWDRLYAALANGGHIDGSDAAANPIARRDLRAALPPLSLFGAALYTYTLAGRMDVEIAWPVCVETVTAGLVDPVEEMSLLPAEDLIAETSMTRHVDRDEHDPVVSGVTPMPTTIEALSTGVRLVGRVRFHPEATSVERAIVPWALDQIQTLGGKGGAGHGSIRIAYDGGQPSVYADWLDEHTDQARQALIALAGVLAGVSAKKGKK